MPQGAAPLSTGSGVDMQVVYAVYRQAKSMGASQKVMISLFEACLVESGFRNINYGDRDSVGVLQQRSVGWGSYAERMNPASAASKFVRKAMAMENRYSTPGKLAQAVQVSAFPSRYDQRYGEAVSLLKKAQSNAGDATTGGGLGGLPDPTLAPPTGGELSAAFAAIFNRENWIRILLILLGILLISIAVLRMSANSSTVKTGAKLAVNFIPGGGVVSQGVKAAAAVSSGKPAAAIKTAKGIGSAVKSARKVAETPK